MLERDDKYEKSASFWIVGQHRFRRCGEERRKLTNTFFKSQPVERQQPCRFQEELIIMQIYRDSFLLFIHSSYTHLYLLSLPYQFASLSPTAYLTYNKLRCKFVHIHVLMIIWHELVPCVLSFNEINKPTRYPFYKLTNLRKK